MERDVNFLEMFNRTPKCLVGHNGFINKSKSTSVCKKLIDFTLKLMI